MLIQFYHPDFLSPEELDSYLSEGWFRNSILLHNSRVICLDGDVHSILNIRLSLNDHEFPKRLRKVWRQNQQRFRTHIQPVKLNQRKEQLYQQHTKRFKGFLFENLDQFLYAYGGSSVFETYEVSVFDGEHLVAYSLFDIGANSIASLLGVFDKGYSKYSLGMYTMMIEIEFAKSQEKSFYYPGYILDNTPNFDYKLRVGDMEYLLPSGVWGSKEMLNKSVLPSRVIKQKMDECINWLSSKNISFSDLLNPYYTMGYIEPFRDELCKSTRLILIERDGKWASIEYFFEEGYYQLSQVKPDLKNTLLVSMRTADDLTNSNEYVSVIYTYEKLLSQAEFVEDLEHSLTNWIMQQPSF